MAPSFWDQRYAEETFAYGTEPNDFLHLVAPHLPKGHAVCLAEGQGRNAVYLAGLGHKVTAMDLSPVGLERASQLAAQRGVTISTQVGDLEHWTPGVSSCDVVVAIWCHLPSVLRRRMHRDVMTWLRPGGAFVVECYRPGQLAHGTGGPTSVDLLPELLEVQEDLAGMQLRVAQEVTRDVQEGPYHKGMSATVQVLAFKPR